LSHALIAQKVKAYAKVLWCQERYVRRGGAGNQTNTGSDINVLSDGRININEKNESGSAIGSNSVSMLSSLLLKS
jgi:hypothetical protein